MIYSYLEFRKMDKVYKLSDTVILTIARTLYAFDSLDTKKRIMFISFGFNLLHIFVTVLFDKAFNTFGLIAFSD
jgi:hypothetical protein